MVLQPFPNSATTRDQKTFVCWFVGLFVLLVCFLTQKPVGDSHKSNHDMVLVISHFTGLTMAELLEPSEKVSTGHLDSEVLNII